MKDDKIIDWWFRLCHHWALPAVVMGACFGFALNADAPMRPMPLPALAMAQAAAVVPVVELPPEVRGLPGEWIPLTPAKLVGGVPKWQLPLGLTEVKLGDLFGEDYAAKAKGKVVKSSTPGRFTVLAWNAKGDVPSDLATCVVVVGDAPPPGPPNPPPGPTPADPLAADVAKAFAGDQPIDAGLRRATAALYAGWYRQAAAIARKSAGKTQADMGSELKAKETEAGLPAGLKATRAVLVADMKSKHPPHGAGSDVVPASEAELIAGLYERYATILEAQK